MNHDVLLDPPATINVAGNHCPYGVGRGVLVVQVLDHIGSKHFVQLPVTIVPGLGRHPFSGGSAATRGCNMIIANNSYLDMDAFTVPLRKDSHCSTLDHLDLNTDATSRTPKIFSDHFRQELKPETVLLFAL